MHYCHSYDTSKYSTNLKSFIRGGSTLWSNPYNSTLLPVANPDLQITGGGGHPDPEIRGGQCLKKFFSALLALFCSKNKGRRLGWGPWIRHCSYIPFLTKKVPLWVSYICTFYWQMVSLSRTQFTNFASLLTAVN